MSMERQHSILVIDDEPTILFLFTAVARRNQLHCVTVADGANALRQIRQRDFNVILLDLQLPGITGFEILQTIQAEKPYLLERTIVVSGASAEVLDELRESVEVWRVVQKPVEVRDLEGEVLACIANQMIQDELEQN